MNKSTSNAFGKKGKYKGSADNLGQGNSNLNGSAIAIDSCNVIVDSNMNNGNGNTSIADISSTWNGRLRSRSNTPISIAQMHVDHATADNTSAWNGRLRSRSNTPLSGRFFVNSLEHRSRSNTPIHEIPKDLIVNSGSNFSMINEKKAKRAMKDKLRNEKKAEERKIKAEEKKRKTAERNEQRRNSVEQKEKRSEKNKKYYQKRKSLSLRNELNVNLESSIGADVDNKFEVSNYIIPDNKMAEKEIDIVKKIAHGTLMTQSTYNFSKKCSVDSNIDQSRSPSPELIATSESEGEIVSSKRRRMENVSKVDVTVDPKAKKQTYIRARYQKTQRAAGKDPVTYSVAKNRSLDTVDVDNLTHGNLPQISFNEKHNDNSRVKSKSNKKCALKRTRTTKLPLPYNVSIDQSVNEKVDGGETVEIFSQPTMCTCEEVVPVNPDDLPGTSLSFDYPDGPDVQNERKKRVEEAERQTKENAAKQEKCNFCRLKLMRPITTISQEWPNLDGVLNDGESFGRYDGVNQKMKHGFKVMRKEGEDFDAWKERRGKRQCFVRRHSDDSRNNKSDEYGIDGESNIESNHRRVLNVEEAAIVNAKRAEILSLTVRREMEFQELTERRTFTVDPKSTDYRIFQNCNCEQLDLGERQTCPDCKALTYSYTCCEAGNVKIPPPQTQHSYIYKLLTEASKAGKHFRTHLGKYNSMLAMAANSCDRQEHVSGPPFVKVNGMVHHLVAGTSVPDKKTPLYHQCYKYDVAEATNYRIMNPVTGNFVRSNILRNLDMVLQENNYLIKQYKTASEIMADMVKNGQPIKNIFVVLKSPTEVNYQGPHQPGTLELPKQGVNSMLYSTEEDGGPGKHAVIIVHRERGGTVKPLGYWNPLQDPMGYPILFNYGNHGFRRMDFELYKNYVNGDHEENEYFRKMREELDPLPFENDGDEMDPNQDGINYEAARKKWKKWRFNKGEEVSEDESDESDVDEDKMEDLPHMNTSTCSQEREIDATDYMELDLSEDEDANVGLPIGTHRFLEDSSDEDNEDDHHAIGANEIINGKDDIERKMDHEEWRSREAAKEKRTIMKEAKLILQYEKIKQFKRMCWDCKDETAWYEFFEKNEHKRLAVDLEFMRRTHMKRLESIVDDACELLDYDMDFINCYYPTENDKLILEERVNEEKAALWFNITYRDDEPKIVKYRAAHAFPTIENDNGAIEHDNIDSMVQKDVGMSKSKRIRPVKNVGKRKYVSRREHALHQFQTRDERFHPYLCTLLLGQLYLIDVALRYIRDRNDTQREQVISLRGTNEDSFYFKKHDRAAKKKNIKLGYAFQLPAKRIGSTAWYRCEFENAMATVDKTGKPDLFITMTGNPEWPEIKRCNFPIDGFDWHSNAFLVNDIFYIKMQNLIDDIVQKEIFGPVVAFCYSIEFQKRGMPHMHMLVTLKDGYKLDTSSKIDRVISAKIPPIPDEDDPDKIDKQRYRDNVINMMVHSSCIGNDGAYCKKRPASAKNRKHTRCTKNFPYDFNDCTSTTDGGKVDYHRPDDGITCEKVNNGKNITVNNQWVVPYNPFLLNKYGCHINVESVTTVDVIKYIYKYIYKGYDKALAHFIEAYEVDDGAEGRSPPMEVRMSKNGKTGVMLPKGLKGATKQLNNLNDRIAYELQKRNLIEEGVKNTAYDEAIMTECFRQMTPSEAAWILQSYKLSGNSHTVVNLSVHEEGKMPIFWRHNDMENVAERVDNGKYKSQLLAWFELNKQDEYAHQFTYEEIPKHYYWSKKGGIDQWIRYSNNRGLNNIVKLRAVSPRFMQCFAVRLLTQIQKGCTSYEDLRTIDGTLYNTPHEAAKAAGIMNSQMEFDLCLAEAATLNSPYHMRGLFATMLIFGGIKDPTSLWSAFKEEFYDRRYGKNIEKAHAAALYHIEYILSGHGLALKDFLLPKCDSYILTDQDMNAAKDGIFMPDVVESNMEADKMEATLNEDQKKAYDTIMDAVNSNGRGEQGSCFFLQGSGGCGKTYIYKTLYHRLQKYNIKVSMMATTGIAATLLINGTTAHRKFQLPLDANENSDSTMKLESDAAKEIEETTVFILDEATMASKYTLQCIDRLLKEIMHSKRPFGGKIMLLGGDWKQLLPVVQGSSSAEAVHHTLKGSYLWKHFKVLNLTKNMRAEADKSYSKLLENVGNGLVNGQINNNVQLAPKCILKSDEEIIESIYGDMKSQPSVLAKSCILTSLNKETSEINDKVLKILPGEERVYKAIDTPRDGLGMQVNPEYFRHDMPTGLPPYLLHLKVIEMRDTFIVCKLLTTNFAGDIVWIGKIPLEPAAKGRKNSAYSRNQLPVRLAYSMTINKSQGQTFDRVGIILKNNVFAHGQLYVALSRARDSNNVKVYSEASIIKDGKEIIVAKNKVIRSVLEKYDENDLIDSDYEEPLDVNANVWEPPSRPVRRRQLLDHSKSNILENIHRKHHAKRNRKIFKIGQV